MSAKYLLSSRAPYTSSWTKNYSPSLTIALETAWRKHGREWSVDSIAQEQVVVFNRDELLQAFTQIDNLKRDEPKLSLSEISERVIREMGKAGADE